MINEDFEKFNNDFEKAIYDNYKTWDNFEPEKFIEGMHPYFPNRINSEWVYPLKPTLHAMYFFGELKKKLSNLITGFEMALEVCVKTDIESVVFIDIAIWYGDEKHAIEVHGDTKKIEDIDKKTDSIEPHGWIVHHVFNSQIEDEKWLKLCLMGLLQVLLNLRKVILKTLYKNVIQCKKQLRPFL